MNREEHLKWCKDRASEYLDQGDVGQAMASFISDMGKHPETASHSCLKPPMSAMFFMEAAKGVDAMRRHINGFN